MAKNNKKFEKNKKNIKYWQDGASSDLKAAESLFEKRLYPQCLFFCHLAVEKLLKSLVIKKIKEPAPYIHDLRRLADIAKLDLDVEREKLLDDISAFNISGRYPEEKFLFYEKYNKKDIAEKYLNITKDLFVWLKK